MSCLQGKPLNARHVIQRQRRARRRAEQDEIDLLKGVLLFDEQGAQNFDKRYLPPPIDLAWVREYGTLEGPQPDHLFGYRHCKDSDSTTTALSMQQEYGLLSRAVAPALHFHSMSAQWKSPKKNQQPFQARLQGMIPWFVQCNQERPANAAARGISTSSTPMPALSQLSRTQRTSPSQSIWSLRMFCPLGGIRQGTASILCGTFHEDLS
jgi:hypothetical protein